MTTTISILKLSAARCERFNTSNLCLSAMDPYCTWDNNQQRCILYTKLSSTFSSTRRLLTCPILNATSMCLLMLEFLFLLFICI